MLLLPYIFYVEEVAVPSLLNHNISTGEIILKKNKLNYRVQYIPSNVDENIGTIIHSLPLSGKKVKSGTLVDIKDMGSKIDTVFYDYWDIICTDPKNLEKIKNLDILLNECNKYKKNIVWKQFPESGVKVFKDKSVTLHVSRGKHAPEFYSIPILIDLD